MSSYIAILAVLCPIIHLTCTQVTVSAASTRYRVKDVYDRHGWLSIDFFEPVVVLLKGSKFIE
jgi:hypothetical protein